MDGIKDYILKQGKFDQIDGEEDIALTVIFYLENGNNNQK